MKKFLSWVKKLTIFFLIRRGQNQFFGLFSAPDDPKSKTQIYLESASKNTSEKNATKKNYITPTQIFDVKGRFWSVLTKIHQKYKFLWNINALRTQKLIFFGSTDYNTLTVAFTAFNSLVNFRYRHKNFRKNLKNRIFSGSFGVKISS